jgi:TIR domain
VVEVLESIAVATPEGDRLIQLYYGDLTRIPPEEAVDLLVVSAFPGDYFPTPTSLIGALDRAGVSVAELSREMAEDLRSEYGCWLSQPIPDEINAGFDRILCFEPGLRGSPPEVVGDIFRALIPIVEGGIPISTIAMPLVASGDARWPSEQIFEPLLDAAVKWLQLGLPIDVIKIVERSRQKAELLRQTMTRLKGLRQAPLLGRTDGFEYDVFMSYAHEDGEAADYLVRELEAHPSRPRVFQDKPSIRPGDPWQQEVWEALDACRRIVALYSEAYLTSKVCQEEYNIARTRQRNEGGVLVPIYLVTTKLPTYIRILDYVDCRESDRARLRAASTEILAG